jgi:citrate synthase
MATIIFLSLDDPGGMVGKILSAGGKILGWGGTFQKDAPDPIWAPVDQLLTRHWPVIGDKLDSVTDELHRHGKILWPNPSAYTAATCITIGLPAPLAPYLFIAGRLSAWTQIATRVI